MFHSDVAYGCNGFQVCFRCVFQVFDKHVSSVSTAFRRMLQPLYLDVLKVDRVLHLSSSHFCCIVSPGAGRAYVRTRDGLLARDEGAACVTFFIQAYIMVGSGMQARANGSRVRT